MFQLELLDTEGQVRDKFEMLSISSSMNFAQQNQLAKNFRILSTGEVVQTFFEGTRNHFNVVEWYEVQYSPKIRQLLPGTRMFSDLCESEGISLI